MARAFRTIGRRDDGEPTEVVETEAKAAGEAAVEGAEAEAGGEAAGNGAPAMPSLAEVGEHVTAVLTSAQQAADRMRNEARQEAERVRAEARERAEAAIDGAKQTAADARAEADAYDKNVRHHADVYSDEKRTEAEEYARRAVGGAKDEAEAIREQARVEAGRMVEAGRRRSEALAAEVRHFEERLDRLHTVFAGMTNQLGELLQPGSRPQSGEDTGDADEERAQAGAGPVAAAGSG
jgi:vacuolar-type H+-ATPase subunit E/Vma4